MNLPSETAAAEGNSQAGRVLAAGLGLAILAVGLGSWNTLMGMREAAAESEARDAKLLEQAQAENTRLAGRPAPALTATVPVPKGVTAKPPLGEQRVEALGFLTDLGRRGYFATPSPMTLLRQLAGPVNPNIKRVPQPAYMIDANGNFGPGFGEFFGLAAEEDLALQAGLSAWKEEQERALLANTTVRRQDDGSVVLEVNPVPDAAAMRERFTSILREGLGPDRYRAFIALNSGPRPMEEGPLPAMLTGNMNFFGEATGTYTVVRRTPTTVSINSSLKIPNGGNSSSGSSGPAATPEALREQLIKANGPVMKLLPVDF